jgi:uncharacterized cupin superfamily protein
MTASRSSVSGSTSWSRREAFLVLSGECRLLVESEERLLRPRDFFHSPAGTEYICVGAGDGPCVILMAGSRSGDWKMRYPVSELAARFGASAEKQNVRPGTRRTRGSSRHGGSGRRTGIASLGPTSPKHE